MIAIYVVDAYRSGSYLALYAQSNYAAINATVHRPHQWTHLSDRDLPVDADPTYVTEFLASRGWFLTRGWSRAGRDRRFYTEIRRR